MNRSGKSQLRGLFVSGAVCFAAATIGSLVTTPNIGGWYAALHKPAWTPPNWVFGPVWTALYLAMAVAAWLVWRRTAWPESRGPLGWFLVQLALNAAWSWLFFGAKMPGAALAELIVLWVAIAVTLALFWRRSAVAGMLLVPYLLWVTYAATLNLAIWRLNG
jgi:tryptophan-rich sensory protein